MPIRVGCYQSIDDQSDIPFLRKKAIESFEPALQVGGSLRKLSSNKHAFSIANAVVIYASCPRTNMRPKEILLI